MKECGNCVYFYSCGYSSFLVGKLSHECIEPHLFEAKQGLVWCPIQQQLRPENELIKDQEIAQKAANAILIKPNQIGTLMETLEVEPTSPFISIFSQQPPTVPLDAWVEIDVYFPPKSTRPLIGKLVKRGRAKFSTAFIDDLVEM